MINWLYRRKNAVIYDSLHDKRTGLFNSSGFDLFLKDAILSNTTIVLFELAAQPNNPEKEMVKLTESVKEAFSPTDHICRIKEDQIAVIRTGINREDTQERIQTVIKKAGGKVYTGSSFGGEHPYREAKSALNCNCPRKVRIGWAAAKTKGHCENSGPSYKIK